MLFCLFAVFGCFVLVRVICGFAWCAEFFVLGTLEVAV